MHNYNRQLFARLSRTHDFSALSDFAQLRHGKILRHRQMHEARLSLPRISRKEDDSSKV
jgi:hypothetical protein